MFVLRLPFLRPSYTYILLGFFGGLVLLTGALPGAENVVISEFMASNTSGIRDEDNASSDWIEIFNNGASTVNLAGWRLTDDASDKSKWVFPATNLPPSGFLILWASSKDRRIPGAPLHANFSLNSGGEYLGLVRPDDSIAAEFNPYPKQYDDISYGPVQQTDVSKFINTNAPVKVFIPLNNALGTSWTAVGFSDAAWTSGINGVGYEQSVPGFAIKNYKANVLVGSLSAADTVIATSAQQSATYTENRGTINYFNSGGIGNYGGDVAFPGFDLATDQEDFVVEVTGTVTVPSAGNWTFGVNSDDGFRLNVGSFVMSFPDPRGPADTLATFNFPSAGDYPVRLVFYERGGGSELELFAAAGNFSSWDSSNFRLVGDTSNGGLAVRSLPLGQTLGFKGLIRTDVQSSMYAKSSSAYLRFPFTVGSPGTLNSLTLQLKYDDGFVAYLNGTLVASRNAPVGPQYNSVATSEHPDDQAVFYETIDLSSNINLLVSGNNVLTFHGLNRANDNDDFLMLAELSEYRTTLVTNNYFAVATPANYNSTTLYSKVRDTQFSHDRGFYDSGFDVSITCDTPGATIRYTLDGTIPTLANGTTYTAPIPVNKTTTLRAAAFRTGFTSSDVDTQTYIFTGDVINQSPTGSPPAGWPASWGANTVDYGMDPQIVTVSPWKETIQEDLKSIPTFSIVMKLSDLFDASTGIYANPGNDTLAWERPCSLELIYSDGKQGFHENCGIRIRGGFSRSTGNPKHAFRFFFRQEYGVPKLNFPLFGSKAAKTFDKFDLRTTQNYSWAFQGDAGSIFLRDQFSRDTQLAMGQLGERGNWFHLYINGVYWGLYNTDERAEASFGESYLGGSEENYDTIKVGPDQGYNIYATDGNTDAWQRLWQAAVDGFSSDASYYRVQGLNPEGTPNPAYENLLDVANLIDYMLVIIYGGNLDAPISNFLSNNSPNNWFGIRDRTGLHGGFRFMSHDAEHTLLNVNEDRSGPYAAGDPSQGSNFGKSSPQYIYTRLWANTEFRIFCADRIQKHFFNGGVFTVSNAQERLDLRTNEIVRALVPESARWGDAKRGNGPPITRNDWMDAYNNVRNNYLPARGSVVLNQLRNDGLFPNLNAPGFSPFGGLVPFGYNLTLANNNASGTIYYTLDGSDPRLRGGSINPNAAAYSTPIVLNTAKTVRARTKDGSTWSAIVEATFYPLQDFNGLAVTEIMYSPPGEALISGDEFEFIELKNTTANAIDLSGLAFTDGVDFSFPNESSLAPGQFFVLARNSAQFKARYPNVPVRGVFTGKLDNGGETLRLKHALGGTVFTVTYDDDLPWPITPHGFGYSLVPRNSNPSSNSEDGSHWRASAAKFGSPGADDPTPTAPVIVVNEVLAHTDPPALDSIELYNPTSSSVNLGGWFLSDDPGVPNKFRIPNNTIIGPGGYRVFTEADFDNPPDSPASFLLKSTGDQVILFSADAAGTLTGYSHGVSFGASQNGVSFGRYVNSQGEELFPAQTVATFNAANAGPLVGPIVITEIQYHPNPTDDEFLELHNLASTNVPLYDLNAVTNTWKVSGLGYTFPQNITIAPKGFLILSSIDPALFRSRYAVPSSVQILGPYVGSLQDSGERLQLTRPDAPNTNAVPYIIEDEVRYNDKAPWPVVADGSGPSLQRLVPSAYGNDPTNWFSSGITPGKANVFNASPTVTLSAPAEGSTFIPPANITLEATASDSDGNVSRVEFYADGVKLGEDSSAPYSLTWNNAAPGSHSLTARAIDDGFSIGQSPPVQITIYTPTPTTAIERGTVWKYRDSGVYPGDAWKTVGYNDGSWAAGAAPLGYGDGDETTVVSFGADSGNKFITTWFRQTFSITNLTRYLSLRVSLLRDDGGVVYLNGTEVFRSNMPEGSIAANTPAVATVGGGDESSTFYSSDISPALLLEGKNLLAVEIHQQNGTSSDISFDLELVGTLAPIVPTVQLTSPANNSTYVAPANITLAASAADPESGIAKVEFYQGATKIGEDPTAPYTFDWNAVSAGTYQLRAVAIGGLGLARTSGPVAVTVQANIAPTVSITSPADNSQFVQPSTINIQVTADDPDGSVAKVEFFADNVKIGEDAISPYRFDWVGPILGPHTLKAIAFDNRGVSTTSSFVKVTVTNVIQKPISFISFGAAWKYHDRGQFPGSGWTNLNFDDGAWSDGLAQLGYSPDENDEATVLNFGSDPNNKFPTYYFRQTFNVADPAAVSELTLQYIRDDGLVAYLNGQEIVRDNLPSGTIGYADLAINSVGGVDESAVATNALNPSLLVKGLNVLAVEIHQQSVDSSDLSFDAKLEGVGQVTGPAIGSQPLSQSHNPGDPVLLAVTASGTIPLSYQWKKDGNPINGATSHFIVWPAVQENNAGSYTVTISNEASSATSSAAILTVSASGTSPKITTQPQSQTVLAGNPVTFTVVATGTPPLTYRWRKGVTVVSEGATASLVLAAVQPTDAGDYDVVVINGFGNAASAQATLSVNSPPAVTVQPQPQVVPLGGAANFSVQAVGGTPLTYQWLVDGNVIPGANSVTFVLSQVQFQNQGKYSVRIANPYGDATSDEALLTVITLDSDGDGMPDWWEDKYQLNKNSAADAAQDSDGDGISNLDEFLADTDPRDSSSALRLTVTRTRNGVLLRFTTAPNRGYTLEYRNDAETGSWRKFTDFPPEATSQTMEVTDPAGSASRFYRVITTPTTNP